MGPLRYPLTEVEKITERIGKISIDDSKSNDAVLTDVPPSLLSCGASHSPLLDHVDCEPVKFDPVKLYPVDIMTTLHSIEDDYGTSHITALGRPYDPAPGCTNLHEFLGRSDSNESPRRSFSVSSDSSSWYLADDDDNTVAQLEARNAELQTQLSAKTELLNKLQSHMMTQALEQLSSKSRLKTFAQKLTTDLSTIESITSTHNEKLNNQIRDARDDNVRLISHIKSFNEAIHKKDDELQEKDYELSVKDEELQLKTREIEGLNEAMQQKDAELQKKDNELSIKNDELQLKTRQIEEMHLKFQMQDKELELMNILMEESRTELQAEKAKLDEDAKLMSEKRTVFAAMEEELSNNARDYRLADEENSAIVLQLEADCRQHAKDLAAATSRAEGLKSNFIALKRVGRGVVDEFKVYELYSDRLMAWRSSRSDAVVEQFLSGNEKIIHELRRRMSRLEAQCQIPCEPVVKHEVEPPLSWDDAGPFL